MAKQVKQFRFYSDGNPKNSIMKDGSKLDSKMLMNNNIFQSYPEISQIGIQSLPGTEFYLNNSTYPIMIGNTGIYELDVNGITDISNIYFEEKSIKAINKSATAYLIIDIIYDDGM